MSRSNSSHSLIHQASHESLLNQPSSSSSHTFRHYPTQEVRSSHTSHRSRNPISFLSLAGLSAGVRNVFFQRTITPLGALSPKGYGAVSDGEDENGDLESQSDRSERTLEGSERMRVDPRIISDATIGLSDGLTVPFALTAGLSALGNTKVVIYGGFAELIAGAISMGLGGYLGAQSEKASYNATRLETEEKVVTSPKEINQTLYSVFEPYSLPPALTNTLVNHLSTSPHLVDFLMSFHHNETPPSPSRALTSAITIALAYFLGGLLPLTPYFFVGTNEVYTGLYWSIGVMVLALFAFGYSKTCVVEGWEGGRAVRGGCKGGVQMVIVGSVAAGAAMGLVRAFNHEGNGV